MALTQPSYSMFQNKTRVGYCSECDENVLHVRRLGSYFDWFLDLMSARLARYLRDGPWYCCQCGKRSRFTKRNRRSAPTNRHVTVEGNMQAVRNYIRSDQSLLLQKQRAARFSSKFRDGIVMRLASGTASMDQLCRELNISENDLVSWIADLLSRRQAKIDDLQDIVKRMQSVNPHLGHLENHTTPHFLGDDLIEGQFQRNDGK